MAETPKPKVTKNQLALVVLDALKEAVAQITKQSTKK